MGETLKLCMLAPEFFPVWGGVGSYTIELLKSLPKNVDIHVVTLEREIPGWSGKDYTNEIIGSILKRPVHIHYLSKSKETFMYNLSFQLACLRSIPSLHKKHRFDIIHSHLCHMPDLFLKLIIGMSVPTVLTIHGTIQSLREHAIWASSLFGGLEESEKSIVRYYPIIELLQQRYAKKVDRFIAVSEATKKFASSDLKVSEDKISTVYNGVDTTLFAPPNEEQKQTKYSNPTIVYIGRIIAKKGINTLIQAIPNVLLHYPDAKFVFVGGGNLDFYKEKLSAMGVVKKNFKFTGHLGYFERLKILQEATVFVNPSFFENFSISVLEAMSCGCATIACYVGGNPELINSGKNGILVRPFDSNRLADSIIALLTDESYNREIGLHARETIIQSFSSEICASETFKVYKQTIDC